MLPHRFASPNSVSPAKGVCSCWFCSQHESYLTEVLAGGLHYGSHHFPPGGCSCSRWSSGIIMLTIFRERQKTLLENFSLHTCPFTSSSLRFPFHFLTGTIRHGSIHWAALGCIPCANPHKRRDLLLPLFATGLLYAVKESRRQVSNLFRQSSQQQMILKNNHNS